MSESRRFGAVARTILPFTARGIVVAVFSAGLLALGIARADLAALFWSASFLAFSLYAVLGGHAYRIALARRHARAPHFLSAVLPGRALTPGETAEAAASFRLPRPLPPGFSLAIHVPLRSAAQRFRGIRVPVSTREVAARSPFTAPRRGVYECSEALLVSADVLGLTEHRFPVALRESLVVVPRLTPRPDPRRFVEQTDESSTVSSRRRRSETLLEVRKYYPGDDPRRLNWKVFAHTDELFLRIGEEVPAPESRLLFVLDTTANPLIPKRLAADYLDSLVEACGSVMTGLLSRGVDLMLSLPGDRECRSFSDGSGETLRRALAGAWWTAAPWQPEVPVSGPHVVVFSSPGSPGLGPIARTIRARAWTSTVFVKSVPPGPSGGTMNARRLLFLVPHDSERRGARLRRAESVALQSALSRDLDTYGERRGEARHAAEI